MSVRNLYPQQRPTLNLNFAQSKILDPRITFTRTSTATYVDEDGFIKTADSDVARFDHDPVTGECLGLLIEELRSNLVTYSEKIGGTFATYGWANQNSIGIELDTADVSDPSGGNTASKLTNGSTSPVSQTLKTSSLSATVYTASVYLRTLSGTETASIIVFLQSPPYTTIANSGELTITSEWQRFDITTSTATSADYNFGIQVRSGTIYAWGAQLEQGSFPTSYIPTEGSTKTRNPDNVSMTGTNFSDWYNPTEGTVYTELSLLDVGNTGGKVLWSINQVGGFGEGFYMVNENNQTSIVYNAFYGSSNQAQFAGPTGITTNQYYKTIFSYQENNVNACFDGNVGTVDTSVGIATVGRLTIGNNAWGNTLNPGDCHIKSFTYYPSRLPNEQLQNLTK